MTTEKMIEMVKLAILAYEENGEANFSVTDLVKIGLGNTSIRNTLKEMCNRGLIENRTVNGYYSRYKLNYTGTCPKFIYDDLTNGQKDFLIRVNNVLKGDYTPITGKKLSNLLYPNDPDHSSGSTSSSMSNIKKFYNGKSIFEILKEWEPIKLKIEHPYYKIIKDENGYRLVSSDINLKHHCQYCGEEDPSKFAPRTTKTCRKCQQKINKEHRQEDIYNFLFQKAKSGYKNRPNIPEFSITKEDIENTWIKQNKLDYYTGLSIDDFTDMSVDRIDSSKGYTPENICITSIQCNIAKNDYTESDFVKMCYQVAKHYYKKGLLESILKS